MDIPRLLSPCLDLPLPPSHASLQSAERVDARSVKAQALPTNDTSTVPTPPRDEPSVTPKRTSSSTFAVSRTTLSASVKRKSAGNATETIWIPPPVKRKRKRRFSAQQKQVMHENEQDESLLYNLTLDVNELKRQVRDVLVQKRVFETRALAQKKVAEARALVVRQLFNAAVLRTTQRLFEIFSTGFREWGQEEDAFLAITIHKNIILASGVRGVDVFFEQWRRYTKLLQVRSVSASSIRILVNDPESNVVECKGELEGKLTLAAIETIFPHILQNTELLSKVVDCQLVCPTRTLIYYDESGRIVQYDSNVDMFAGLSLILRSNPMDVVALMASARINIEGSLIPDPEGGDRVREIHDDDPAQLKARAKECGSVPVSPVGSASAKSLTSISPSRSCCSSCGSMDYILS